MKAVQMLMMRSPTLEKIKTLSNFPSNLDIVYYDSKYWFVVGDKLLTLSEDLTTETLTASNPDAKGVVSYASKALDLFGTDVILVTERAADGCILYSYAGATWTERYNWGTSTNAINDIFAGTKLYCRHGEGTREFNSAYSQTSIGFAGTQRKVCENGGVVYLSSPPYAYISSVWTLLDAVLTFLDVATDGTDVLYFNSTSVYKVSGTSLVKLHDISVGNINYVYYSSNRGKFYFVDSDNMLWEYDKTTGIKSLYEFDITYVNTVYGFTENSSNELILHVRKETESDLYKII